MNDRRPVSLSTGMVILVLMAVPATGLAQSATRNTATPARTVWGAPNLQGMWDLHTITPLERPEEFRDRAFLTEEDVTTLERAALNDATDEARPADSERDVGDAYNDFWWDRATTVVETRRTSLIVEPSDGRLPALTPEAEQREAVERSHRPLRATGRFEGGRGADTWADRSLWERCLTQGLPRLSIRAYNANVQIFQTPDYVAIHHEMIHETRLVPLDKSPHLHSGIRQWMGDSRGRWDGDTLVVDTTNFSDRTNFRGSTDGLHMVERFTRLDANTLLYEATFEDPTTWTRPWSAEHPLRTSPGPIFEYACHEGNYGMENLLTSGRALDTDQGRSNAVTPVSRR